MKDEEMGVHWRVVHWGAWRIMVRSLNPRNLPFQVLRWWHYQDSFTRVIYDQVYISLYDYFWNPTFEKQIWIYKKEYRNKPNHKNTEKFSSNLGATCFDFIDEPNINIVEKFSKFDIVMMNFFLLKQDKNAQRENKTPGSQKNSVKR